MYTVWKVRVRGGRSSGKVFRNLRAAESFRERLITRLGLDRGSVHILERRPGGGWFLLYGVRR